MKSSENLWFPDDFRGNRINVVLVSSLLTLTYFTPIFSVSIVDFEQLTVSWVINALTVNQCDHFESSTIRNQASVANLKKLVKTFKMRP